MKMRQFDPEKALVSHRREFGEHGGVAPSIERSSTFTVMKPGTMPAIFEGKMGVENEGCYLYSRHFNPTVHMLACDLAAMEKMEWGICTASGISAIACALLQICRRGDHMVASDTIYGGSHALLKETFPDFGISTTFVDPTDTAAFEAAMQENTKVVYVESVGNPTLKVADIPRLAEIAHKHGAKLVVDNTFTPCLITPAELGADVTVYSMTKYINGASDVVAGAILGTQEFIFQLMDLHTGRVMLLGPTMDPRTAFDIHQRLPHLPIRMREHSRRAQAIAERLQELKLDVIYPGLPSHPQHELYKSILNEGYGFGGMIGLDCGTQEKAEEVMDLLQNREDFGYIAVSLGYFDTLISCSGSSTSSEISEEEQREMGLSPGLLRIAIGYTGALEDRLDQIERACKDAGLC
jgi:methionine-gamma-lyase